MPHFSEPNPPPHHTRHQKVTVLRKLFKVDRFFLLPELQVITVFILSKEFTLPPPKKLLLDLCRTAVDARHSVLCNDQSLECLIANSVHVRLCKMSLSTPYGYGPVRRCVSCGVRCSGHCVARVAGLVVALAVRCVGSRIRLARDMTVSRVGWPGTRLSVALPSPRLT